MPARSPEELDRLFAEAVARGDVDALLTLYEPGASLTDQSGQVASGGDALRQSITPFAAMKPNLDIKVTKVVQAGDIALMYSSWNMDAGGQQMTGQGTEVARRQPDGTWRFIIDDPFTQR